MNMKKIFLLLTAAALCTVACTENKTEEASLSVNPTQIEFIAENAPATDVTVTAVGVKWDVSVAETASGWLTAEKVNDKTVTVTATDNTTADQRVGSVIITSDDKVVGNREITVVQAGSETPVVYDLQLSSSLLEFEPENAETQTVTVTVSGAMGWKAEAAENCSDWVTVTSAADSFTIKVNDNPNTTERIGTVVVTPDNESTEPKEVTIKQKPKVLPPSLTVDKNELSFKFRETTHKRVMITLVNCEWRDVELKDEDGNTPAWLHVTKNTDDPEHQSIDVNVDMNESDKRTAYIDLVADTEAVEKVRITVTQEAYRAYFSELTEDTDISAALKNSRIKLNIIQDWMDDSTAALVSMNFWSDGVTYLPNGIPGVWPLQYYTGTGEYIEMEVYSDKILYNEDQDYDITAHEYSVVPYESDMTIPYPQFTVAGGTVAEWDPNTRLGTWYYRIENDQIVCKAPITTGTLNIERDGENYILTLNFTDDLENTISGTYNGILDVIGTGEPRPEPPIAH